MNDGIEINRLGKVLEVKVTGKLTKEFYRAFTPQVDEMIREQGKIRVLCVMHDFHGWTAGALWEDIKFDLKHWKDIERLVIVGEAKWEKGMANFCRPFTSAEVKYFDIAQIDQAREWLTT